MDSHQVQTILNQFQNAIDLTTRERSLFQVIEYLVKENNQLREENQHLRDEIARLKGEKGKPKFKKNHLPKDKNDPSWEALHPPKKHKKSGKKEFLPIDEVRKIPLDRCSLPTDVQNKGIDTVVIQEICFHRNNIQFELEQYYSRSERKTYRASLPKEYRGFLFGPELRSYILHQYHQNRVTEPLLLTSLNDFGIEISAGELSNILTYKSLCFAEEADAMYKAGLEVSPYVHVDDTGARHKASNHYTTVICNDLFTMYFTRKHKSRLNFLDILSGGKGLHYHFDTVTEILLKEINLSIAECDYFSDLDGKIFTSLDDLSKTVIAGLGKLPGKRKWIRIAESAALSYYLDQTDYRPIEGLVSDEAKQFELFYWLIHGICWVHIDRDYKKLILYSEEEQTALGNFRTDFWNLYKKLKTYSKTPSGELKSTLSNEFDQLFSRQTGSKDLDLLIAKTRQKKEKMLAVLEAPYLPLHNNPAEQDQRPRVIKGKISYGTRSEAGLKALDIMQSLMRTCKKLGISFWEYIKDRTTGLNKIPPLAELIHAKAALMNSSR